MEYKGIEYLRSKLDSKRSYALKRYDYYDMEDGMDTQILSNLPPKLQNQVKYVGWIPRAVDTLVNKLKFNGFGNDDTFNLTKIFDMNNKDVLFRNMFKGAIISSCDFVYISKNTDGSARLEVIDGSNATGILDNSTMLLTEGYAVIERDPETGNPIEEAYFTENATYFYRSNEGEPYQVFKNDAPYPLLVPVIYNSDATKPFGRSHITKSLMTYVEDVKTTLVLMAISSLFYSYPQRYALGLNLSKRDDEDDEDYEEDEEATKEKTKTDKEFDSFKAAISTMLVIGSDRDGNAPTLGQFSQQSMAPYNDQLKTYASLFAGETGMTLDDLGFTTENPSSAEAITAAHAMLQELASDAQDSFSTGIRNIGYLAKCVQDKRAYRRDEFAEIKIRWKPVYPIDSSKLSALGDSIYKINEVIPNFITKETLEDLTGLEGGSEEPSYKAPMSVRVQKSEESEEGEKDGRLNN